MSEPQNDPGRDDNLMNHEYDGIREFDNPTPGWWHAIFILTVIFAILYFAVYEMSPLGERWGVYARHQNAMDNSDAASLRQLGELTADGATLIRLSSSEFALQKGGAIYAARCVPCHKADGGGMMALGPNLTDNFGKNVRIPEDVYTTIADGVAATAMVPWESQIGQDDCVLVAAYVISLRGNEITDGKEPEGDMMPAWPAPPAAGE
jgi:cytochrome c oxidase cbb3-type subunit 3